MMLPCGDAQLGLLCDAARHARQRRVVVILGINAMKCKMSLHLLAGCEPG